MRLAHPTNPRLVACLPDAARMKERMASMGVLSTTDLMGSNREDNSTRPETLRTSQIVLDDYDNLR
jgi:hypothetical protein